MDRYSSWLSAKETCGPFMKSSLPQFSDKLTEQYFNNVPDMIRNLTFWLGLQKNHLKDKKDCTPVETENDTKFTDFTLDECSSVSCSNVADKVVHSSCGKLQHPLCVKTTQPEGTVS
jgi:hypothetical protein